MKKRTFLVGMLGLGVMGQASILAISVWADPVWANDKSPQKPPQKPPKRWQREWANTDFSRASVSFDEIMSGGPGKDDIPAIDDPQFVPGRALSRDTRWLGNDEPVISLTIGADSRAYPISVMMWHEIVNDVVGGVPVSITYCPLCNSALVFERRYGGMVLDFGTTGKLRKSDMVMYDRQTESWWQQFVGEAMIGELTGARLKMVPARIESFALFLDRHPGGLVLAPGGAPLRSYGKNPYEGYDKRRIPLFYAGKYRGPVPAMSRVVSVDEEAWGLDFVKSEGRIESGDVIITWQSGQRSPLHRRTIRKGRDIGNVLVQRRMPDGTLVDVVYDVPFAFAFEAFHPNGIIHAGN